MFTQAGHRERFLRRDALLWLFTAALVGCASHESGANHPGGSIASGDLERDVSQHIWMFAFLFGDRCEETRVVDTAVIESPRLVGVDRWVELWKVDQCGERVDYRVEFTPSQEGVTEFVISLSESDQAP